LSACKLGRGKMNPPGGAYVRDIPASVWVGFCLGALKKEMDKEGAL